MYGVYHMYITFISHTPRSIARQTKRVPVSIVSIVSIVVSIVSIVVSIMSIVSHTERYVFVELSARCLQRRPFWHRHH